MKIEFEEGGYVEFSRSGETILLVIQAIDGSNNLKTITNACELTEEQFQDLCKSLNAK